MGTKLPTLLTICWVVISGLVLGACKAREAPPMAGRIVLEYVSTSDSAIAARLVNASNRVIRIRGSHTISWAIGTWPGDAGFECESIRPGPMDEDPMGISEGNPGSVEVLPGGQVRLKIYTAFPQKYQGRRCQLKLRLDDGTIVGPIDFQP